MSYKIDHKPFTGFVKAVSGLKMTATDWRNLRTLVADRRTESPVADSDVRLAVDGFAAALFDEFGYYCWLDWRSDDERYEPIEGAPAEPIATPEEWDEARMALEYAVFEGGVLTRAPVAEGDVRVLRLLSTEGVTAAVKSVRAAARAAKAAK